MRREKCTKMFRILHYSQNIASNVDCLFVCKHVMTWFAPHFLLVVKMMVLLSMKKWLQWHHVTPTTGKAHINFSHTNTITSSSVSNWPFCLYSANDYEIYFHKIFHVSNMSRFRWCCVCNLIIYMLSFCVNIKAYDRFMNNPTLIPLIFYQLFYSC